MKLIKLGIAILAIAFSADGSLSADERAPVENCTWCHGTSGQGFSTAPRIAGQRHQYIENQLLDLKAHTRDNPFSKQYMWGAVAALSPQAVHDLAMYFSTIPPRPANDGEPELAAQGRSIYDNGIPDANIVACVVCHAPNAEGIRQIPRLAGLTHSYLKRKLEQWGEGYHADAEPPMPRIAGKLSPKDIDALASYLSFVK
jgi:cytochrome c553